MRFFLVSSLLLLSPFANSQEKDCDTPAGNIKILQAYLANIGHPVMNAVLCDPNTSSDCLSKWRNIIVVGPKSKIGFDPRCHLAAQCPKYAEHANFKVNDPDNNCEQYDATPVRLSKPKTTIPVDPNPPGSVK